MSESPGTRMSTQPASSASLDVRATPEQRLRALSPAVGWELWLQAALRDLLVAGVRAGSIEGDLAKRAAEYIVDQRLVIGFLNAVTFVHDLATRFDGLEEPLRPVRAEVVEYVEPLVADCVTAAIGDGRYEEAADSAEEFLRLAAGYTEGRLEPAQLAKALQRLVNGGTR